MVRAGFAALGSAAAEGPVIDWVATHRKHHQFSDVDGDPHSPHVGHGSGWRGALSGLLHAHVGWVFRDMEVADERRYAKDLLADPLIRFVDRTFVLWVAAGLAAAFGLGVLLTGTVKGGLVALLWGGAARIFFMHHATFSINSLCHYFGRHDYDTGDESRNLAWLAIPTWGEAWHNNHHAFPTSYRHGLRRWQIDPSAAIIRMLEMTGLAWDVVRVDPHAAERKANAGRRHPLTRRGVREHLRTAARARVGAAAPAVLAALLGRHARFARRSLPRPRSRFTHRARWRTCCARRASSGWAGRTSTGCSRSTTSTARCGSSTRSSRRRCRRCRRRRLGVARRCGRAGWSCRPSRRRPSCGCAASATRSRATGARSAITTTSATTSSPCSSTSR